MGFPSMLGRLLTSPCILPRRRTEPGPAPRALLLWSGSRLSVSGPMCSQTAADTPVRTLLPSSAPKPLPSSSTFERGGSEWLAERRVVLPRRIVLLTMRCRHLDVTLLAALAAWALPLPAQSP